MKFPRWDDPDFRGGTMSRSALWLLQEVGEGNTFTKEAHRASFPGITQADRRLRDLRDYGWAIDTSASDARLATDEQRFVSAGIPVWEAGARAVHRSPLITAKQRIALFARDSYQCTLCGIGGGEDYEEFIGETATLVASRREVLTAGGAVADGFVTECKRCKSGSDGAPVDFEVVLQATQSLSVQDQEQLSRWIGNAGRERSALDRVWGLVRTLPEIAQNELHLAILSNEKLDRESS